MPRLMLRRLDKASASPAEVAALVAEHAGHILNRTDDVMLVDIGQTHDVASIKDNLPGWMVLEQGLEKVPLPDSRLKIGSQR